MEAEADGQGNLERVLCTIGLDVAAVVEEHMDGAAVSLADDERHAVDDGHELAPIHLDRKAEVLRKFFQVLEGHPHGHDAGSGAAVVRYLVADHGP